MSTAMLMLALLAPVVAAHANHGDATHDDEVKQYQPTLTQVNCKLDYRATKGFDDQVLIVSGTGAKPHHKVGVAWAAGSGEAPWGLNNCPLVTGLSEIGDANTKFIKADASGSFSLRQGVADCSSATFVQALSAPYRSSQCALSKVSGLGPVIGLEGELSFFIEGGVAAAEKARTPADNAGLGVSDGIKRFIQEVLISKPRLEDISLEFSDAPFGFEPFQTDAAPTRRLLATAEQVFVRFNIATDDRQQALRDLKDFAALFDKDNGTWAKGNGIRNNFKDDLEKRYKIKFDESKALVLNNLQYWRELVVNIPEGRFMAVTYENVYFFNRAKDDNYKTKANPRPAEVMYPECAKDFSGTDGNDPDLCPDPGPYQDPVGYGYCGGVPKAYSTTGGDGWNLDEEDQLGGVLPLPSESCTQAFSIGATEDGSAYTMFAQCYVNGLEKGIGWRVIQWEDCAGFATTYYDIKHMYTLPDGTDAPTDKQICDNMEGTGDCPDDGNGGASGNCYGNNYYGSYQAQWTTGGTQLKTPSEATGDSAIDSTFSWGYVGTKVNDQYKPTWEQACGGDTVVFDLATV